MNKKLLIEIGVEELPAISFLKELPNIKQKYQKTLNDNAIFSEFDFFYTPRRLVFYHESFPVLQEAKVEEFFGAPLKIAFKDNQPTKAAISFAAKCNILIQDLQVAKKNNQDVLYYKKQSTPLSSTSLLPKIISEFLSLLNFGKSMRWLQSDESFIRPIRWINCYFEDEKINFSLYGVEAKQQTFVHRSKSKVAINYHDEKEYFKLLSENGVLFQEERKAKIQSELHNLEVQKDIKIEQDEELFCEIIAITEYPTALIGKFDELFLQMPPEVIITSMKEHQRYFPVFKDAKLSNFFVVVSNSLADDNSQIINGNEKVLKARLSDALFFWQNDLKNGLKSDGLKDILFLNKLGSMQDKVNREEKISHYLVEKYIDILIKEQDEDLDSNAIIKEDIQELNKEVFKYSKADLLSEMVYEFSELQGIMGYYYAKEQNLNKFVALSIKEQYKPIKEDSSLPSTIFSSIIALSLKLDTIMSLFSINQIPTGNKDPYALRRNANGIIKIILYNNFNFSLEDDLKNLANYYKNIDFQKVQDFFIDRLYGILKLNPSILKAVLESGEKDICKISAKAQALNYITYDAKFKDDFSTFKRLANIIKNENIINLKVDTTLFQSDEEKKLYEMFLKTNKTRYENYELKLNSLFGLKPYIDNFFDKVMVNVEDENIKQNRINLVANIYHEFKKIADIKEISV